MLLIVLLLILAIGGRYACSTICPLGIIEELIYKIPFPKKYDSLPYEQYLKKIKYIIFGLLCIIVPTVLIPLKGQIDFFYVKVFGFGSVFVLSLFIYRPFCKYLCPFGVFLGFFNKISPFRYKVDSTCTNCSYCQRVCKMGISPYKDPNHMECIRCGECLKRCPRHSLSKEK